MQPLVQIMSGKVQQSKVPGRGPVSRLSRWLRPRRTTPVNLQESSEDEESKTVLEEISTEGAGADIVWRKGKKGAAKVAPAEGTVQQRREHSPAERMSNVEDCQGARGSVPEIQEVGPAERGGGEVSGGPPLGLFKGMSLPAGFGQRHTQGWVSSNLNLVNSTGGSLEMRAISELPAEASCRPSGGVDDGGWLIAILFCTALFCLTFGGAFAVCATAFVGVLATPLLVPSIFRKKQRKPPPLSIQDPSSKSPEILPTPLQKKPPQRPPTSEPIPSFRPRGTTPVGRRTPRPSFSANPQPTKTRDPPEIDLGELAAVKPRGFLGSVARFGTSSVPASGQNTPQATTPSPAPLSNRSPNPLSNRSLKPLSNRSTASERDFVDPAPGVAPKWPAAAALEDDVSSVGSLDLQAAVRIIGILVVILAALLWSWTGAVLGTAVALLFSVVHGSKAEQNIERYALLPVPARTQSAPATELGRLSRSVQNTPRSSTVSRDLSTICVGAPGRIESAMKRRHSVPAKLVG